MQTQHDHLEFNKIKEKLQELCHSQEARETLAKLAPDLRENVCLQRMEETTAAKQILEACGAPPIPTMKDMEAILHAAAAGDMLLPETLASAAQFAQGSRQLKAYLKTGEGTGAHVALYGRNIEALEELHSEITRCLRGDGLADEASPQLAHIRRKTEQLEGQIKEKLEHILKSRKQYLADSYIAQRAGRYVLPVQRKFQGQFGGSVVEVSAKGSTVFMEPASVAKLQSELDILRIEEDGEVRRILYTLTALVEENTAVIRRNMEVIELLDVVFAKAKLSAAMNANPVALGGTRRLDIRQGRHPLLNAESCIPLDICLEEGTRGVVITGPNTGGKTVTLKTVGLLSMMAQSGLHIPCAAGSYIALHDGFYCDIGDGQDIAQNLSTFSGHMSNVIDILGKASKDSLILFDELGSGTDPAEGMGIAVAVLEELRQRRCMFLVTTHYPQVKDYAQETDGVLTARMAFDEESLRPLYRLEMGKAGESCALHIAKRLGLPQHLLDRAHKAVYDATLPGQAEEKHRLLPAPKSRLTRLAPERSVTDVSGKFQIGDSVALLPGNEIGIVYRSADENGDVIVQVKGEKRKIRHNRIRLQVSAAELYPPDYDFSIIFDTVETRKARHQMNRKFDPNVSITYEEPML